ncbi:phosphopantetheine-binding protein [Streptomyces sp. LMG1-1-1.1]|uniref:phosphopantetheine-binding protein n=1 Tax=Streptomyces sp. LMG1-1-1.1 TaxID=3135245 RepID=UPI003466327E
MITTALTFDELAALMKKAAGVTVDARELEKAPDQPFTTLGLDSLGLLGIVGELETSYSVALPTDAERSKTPAEFLSLVNSTLKTGV